MKKFVLASLCFCICLNSSSLFSQDGLKVKTVSIFKDGTGFFIRTGAVKTENGKFILPDVPDAAFGTFWFNASGDNIAGVSSYEKEFVTDQPLGTFPDLLGHNLNLRANIWTKNPANDKETLQFTGTVEMVKDQVVSLKTATSWMSIPTSSVIRVEFLDKPDFSLDKKENKRVLEIAFKNMNASQSLDMMYLRQGLGWIPSYLVEILEDNKARITLSTNFFNNAEDIENADVQFVVGIPNFKYGGIISPLASNQPFQTFLSSIYGGGGTYAWSFNNGLSNNFSNSFSNVQSQSAYTVTVTDANGATTDDGGRDFADGEGEQGEDLFFYSAKNITLKKGGSGVYELMKALIDCKHIFEASIEANRPDYGYYASQNGEDYRITSAYHSIQLNNNTVFPWTTGSVFVTTTQGSELVKPVSEDKLNYTPPGGKTDIKLTSVPDILVKDTEKEVSRVENKKTFAKIKYDLVTIEGKVTVKNYKEKDVTLTVKRTLTGLLEKSNPEWKTEAKFKEYKNMINEVWDVCWDVDLKAGEEKTITYQYQVYISR